MNVKALCISASTILALAPLACTLGGSPPDDEAPPKAVVEASGPTATATASDVPVEALGSLQQVYVPLSAASFDSLDDALEKKGIGNVKSSDFTPKFEHVTTAFGPAVIAYSSGDWVERESLFQPMSVTQWLEAALADDGASGVIINPGHPGQILALSRAEVESTMSWLPRQDPLPMEVYIAQ